MTIQNDSQSLSLKEQYALRKKEREQKKLSEAVELFESHYLILEKLDTASIGRIIDAMNAIEQGLAPFSKQVPAFKQALDAAEADLTALVSGKAGNDPKKVNATLGKSLALYQGLSEFFRQDLPQLMKLPMFKSIQPGSGNEKKPMTAVPGMNADVLVKAFEQALAITKSGGFLKRLFTSNNLPYVDNKALAQQLSQLSYENLKSLSGLAGMPALTDQQSVNAAASAAVGAPAPGQQAPGGAAPPAQQAGGAGKAPAGGSSSEAQMAQAIEKIGGVDAIAKLITTKQVTDPATLARVLQQALAK